MSQVGSLISGRQKRKAAVAASERLSQYSSQCKRARSNEDRARQARETEGESNSQVSGHQTEDDVITTQPENGENSSPVLRKSVNFNSNRNVASVSAAGSRGGRKSASSVSQVETASVIDVAEKQADDVESDSSGEDESNDIVLNTRNKENLSRKVRSWVWRFFVKDFDKKVNRCKLCSKEYSWKNSQGSTRGMSSHLMGRDHNFPKGGPPSDFVFENKEDPAIFFVPYSAKNLRRCIVNWVVHSDQSFDEVEDSSFRQMMSCASNGTAEIVKSHNTIKSDCEKMHSYAQNWVIAKIQESGSRLSFTPDVVSTRYRMYPLLGISAHWISEEWALKDIGLSMIPLSGPHSGENLNEAFLSNIDQKFSLLNKIMAVTSDSASNNGTFMTALARHCQSENLNHFTRNGSRVNCFAHILNLAVQAFLKAINSCKDYPSASWDEEEEDEDLDEDEDRLFLAPKNLMKKLRKLVNITRSSGQRREQFKKVCEELNIDHLELIIDCPTRWNSSYDMIVRAILMKLAIDRFAKDHSDQEVRVLALTRSEWKYFAILKDLLLDFKVASDAMGNSRFPTLSQTLPYFNLLAHKLNKFLECNSDQEPNYNVLELKGKPEHVAKAAQSARIKLKKYFTLANQPGSIYCMATALHPRFKLLYFKHIGWSDQDIASVKTRMELLWRSLYKPVSRESPLDRSGASSSSHTVIDELWSINLQEVGTGEDDLNVYDPTDVLDELNRYLDGGVETDKACPDALQWWKKHQMEYRHLSRMARDILAIPATSIPIERRFSNLVDIVTPNRATLGAEMIQVLHELKEYLKFGGMELFENILAANY